MIVDCGPEAREPDVREGDLVWGVRIREGFRFVISCWSELNSVFDVGETRPFFGRDDLSDESIDGFPDMLHRFDGCEHDSVNVEWAWSFWHGGDEPIHVDPEQIADHGINSERKTLPRTRTWFMNGVGDSTVSQISNGVSGSFDESGSS